MEKLRLVSVTDADELVLMAGDGRQFTVGVDDELRAAVRRTRRPPMPRPEAAPQRPGPREVQARIRSGESAEEVAARTGLDVEYVRRFEGPVLAEREHVAGLARASHVERDSGGHSRTLEQSVGDAVAAEGHDPTDVAWDSRRVEGTRWDVVASHRVGDVTTTATWRYDTATRSLEPLDADASRFSGPPRQRRLSAVREDVFDVEQANRHAGGARGGGTAELLDVLARQRGRRPASQRGQSGPDDLGGADDLPRSEPPEPDPFADHRSGARERPAAQREAAQPSGRAPLAPAAREGGTGHGGHGGEARAGQRSAPREPDGGDGGRQLRRGAGARRLPAVELDPGADPDGLDLDDLAETPSITPELLPEPEPERPAPRRRRSTRLPTDSIPPALQLEPQPAAAPPDDDAAPPRPTPQPPPAVPPVVPPAARAPASDEAPRPAGGREGDARRDEESRRENAGREVDARRDDSTSVPTPDPVAARPPRPAPTATGRPVPEKPEAVGQRPAAAKSRQRRRRATVPSWDDIVFGARRDDE